jgi:Fe-S-cluster containining protein
MSKSPASPPQDPLPLTLRLRIMSEPVEIKAALPVGQIRLDQVLPLLHQIDDAAIDVAARKSEAEGRPISCCRGCSACCRAQPVPITPAEAYALWRLVEDLPEPRRSDVRAKFADRAHRLHEAGLAGDYLERDPNLTPDGARDIARRYFSLGLACPFLADDGACGVYHDRPFVCRQYLVTSPAALCSNPFDNAVDVLPMPIAAASAFQQVSTDLLGREQFTIPLTLALEYVERHRDELERTFDCEAVARQCVEALAQGIH